jgi:hypothetical protein
MTLTLGRHVEHDERSRAFEFQTTSSPHTVLWHHDAPVLDQGDLGACTGNALAQWVNCAENLGDRAPLTEADAVALYSAATRLDHIPGHYPPDDTGSSGLAVCKAGKRLGYLSAYHWTFSWDGFLRAMQHAPVIVGTVWYQGMFTPDHYDFLVPSGGVAGGHEYLILGVDIENEFVTMLNSWGPTWGSSGRARIRFADFRSLLADQGDVTVPIR